MQKTAGLLLFLASATILMGIVTAEIFYPPGYSVSFNMISTLGSTPQPDVIIREPSAAIFDNSLIAAGVMIISAAGILFQRLKGRSLPVAIGLMGLGTLGVGIFPSFHAHLHPLVAGLSFVFGSAFAQNRDNRRWQK